ncbi:hypothetical protein [Sphingobium sp. YR768]|uniref:hypothetical protein n=1 Tax=Sphingobium sp. YR768 TaxID=1884365 RepID=UPI0008C0C2EA|nr:hypothetical protein [Sphingobium sp. YR768]SEQ47438.1 hypothetical protein SAMN05518866_10149 [Sphingobium sp. YR768]
MTDQSIFATKEQLFKHVVDLVVQDGPAQALGLHCQVVREADGKMTVTFHGKADYLKAAAPG